MLATKSNNKCNVELSNIKMKTKVITKDRKSSIHIRKSNARAVVHNERWFDVLYTIDSPEKTDWKK